MSPSTITFIRGRLLRLMAAALAVAAGAGSPGGAGAQTCPSVVWADEFDGTAVDTSKWSFQVGDGCAEGICGWGNNEEQYYQAGNATVGGGVLRIEARQERVRGKRYTSARLRTLGKGDWTFGRFEARIKMTEGQGIWPAFWMLPTDEVFGGWPRSGEIDIMENIGSEPSTVHGTIHYGDPFPDNQSMSASYGLHGGQRFADGFFEFAVEREAGAIRWFVDDVLFATQTPADIDPFNWPFDERFHVLLNLAVGGNFPGSPDATTVFPQVLEVDYVRVYDGSFPHLTGSRRVDHMASGVGYAVGNAFPGSSFTWSVPAGATIVAGQGTAAIVVDWGASGGDVAVEVSSGCGTETLAIGVKVDPRYVFEATFENFDDPAAVTYLSSTGTLVEIVNPDPSGVNSSVFVGDYTRNPAETFDTLFYGTSSIGDASRYTSEEKRFFMDVRTAAPVGTEILVQLEDSSAATATNYPAGRHSRYHAFTSVQNQWERLAFILLDRPDPGTSSTGVDNIVVLFATNTSNGDVFLFDHFDSYTSNPGGGPPAAPSALSASAISARAIDLAWTDNASDETGFTIERQTAGGGFAAIATVAADVTAYADSGLAPSTTYDYRVRAFNANGDSASSNVASATTQAAGTATTVHVAAITVGTVDAGQGFKHGQAIVTLEDDLGQPVGAATVTGTFSGDFAETRMGTSAATGAAVVQTTATKKGKVAFTFCVDTVAHTGLAYQPADNAVSCASL